MARHYTCKGSLARQAHRILFAITSIASRWLLDAEPKFVAAWNVHAVIDVVSTVCKLRRHVDATITAL